MPNKISIITVNLNNKDGLRKTIESVISQDSNCIEYIIIDGNSTDGSVDVIKQHEKHISYWISEPDKGIYNAMNKGINNAHGEYCLFLNSGDYLHDKSVIRAIKEVSNDIDIIIGSVQEVYPNKKKNIWKLSEEITLRTLYDGSINHQAAFIRKKILDKYPYREDLKICSDRRLFIQALILENCSYSIINKIICNFDMSGISRTMDQVLYQESDMILKELIPKRILQDYKKSNMHLQKLTSNLVKYQGFGKLICRIDFFLIKLYKAIKE